MNGKDLQRCAAALLPLLEGIPVSAAAEPVMIGDGDTAPLRPAARTGIPASEPGTGSRASEMPTALPAASSRAAEGTLTDAVGEEPAFAGDGDGRYSRDSLLERIDAGLRRDSRRYDRTFREY